jgi:hypothetical protein
MFLAKITRVYKKKVYVPGKTSLKIQGEKCQSGQPLIALQN